MEPEEALELQPPVETPEEPTETPDETGTTTPTEAAPQEPTEDDLPAGVKKRLAKQTWQVQEARRIAEAAQREAAELRQQMARAAGPAPGEPTDAELGLPAAPDPQQFRSYEEYVKAEARHSVKREMAIERLAQQRGHQEQQFQAVKETWQRTIESGVEKYDDFEEVARSKDLAISEAMRDAILDLGDTAADVWYFLGKNPAEAAKIAKMTPIGAIRAIGRIEERLSNQPVTAKTSNAPTPIKPPGAGATPGKDPAKMTDEEWLRYERARLKKLGRLY